MARAAEFSESRLELTNFGALYEGLAIENRGDAGIDIRLEAGILGLQVEELLVSSWLSDGSDVIE